MEKILICKSYETLNKQKYWKNIKIIQVLYRLILLTVNWYLFEQYTCYTPSTIDRSFK